MHIDRVKGSFRTLKTEDVAVEEGDGWIPSKKKNVTAEGAKDRVYLVVLVGTGANLGQTRVELYAELADGTETHAVPIDSLNELNLFYGVGEVRQKQEAQPQPERRPPQGPPQHPHQQNQQRRDPRDRPQPRQHQGQNPQGQPRRARIDIPAVVAPAPRKAAPVERVVSTADPVEQHILVALETAGIPLPPKALREMVPEEFFSYLSREVGGPLVLKGKELTCEEAGRLDPEDLYESLEESKRASRS